MHFSAFLSPTLRMKLFYVYKKPARDYLQGIDKLMETMKLEDRMYMYLQKTGEGVFVDRQTLRQEAANINFTNTEIDAALLKLDDMDDIGKIYKDGATRYCWYRLSPKELDRAQRSRKFYDDLA